MVLAFGGTDPTKSTAFANCCQGVHNLCIGWYSGNALGATMPRIVVDISPDLHAWLETQRGEWKPRTAVLRDLIHDAMSRQVQEKQLKSQPPQ